MKRPLMFQVGTHVVFDVSTAERITQLGAQNIVHAIDSLTVGPSRRDSLEHSRLRDQWWAPAQTSDQLCSCQVRWETPVIVWASVSLSDRLNLWRACHWLRHLGMLPSDVLVPGQEPSLVFPCIASVSDHSDVELLGQFVHARAFSPQRFDSAVSLWQKYTDSDPLPLVQSCQRGVRSFKELTPLWAYLASFFPRKSEEGLHLSRLDSLILQLVTSEWMTPAEIFAHDSDAGTALRQLLACAGELFLAHRLNHWAIHGPDVAMERKTNPEQREPPMRASVYRITDRGAQLRDVGCAQLTDAPGLPIGGIETYAGPWVLLDNGYVVRLSQ